MRKIRAKWSKLRGRTPTPEPQPREQVHRSASVPPPTTETDPIPSRPVSQQAHEYTSSRPARISIYTPQAPAGSSPSTAEVPVTEMHSAPSTGTPSSETRPDADPTTEGDISATTDVTSAQQGDGSEIHPKTTTKGGSNVGDMVTGAVRLALDITESLSDGVPFLPGAVKALKTVVEAYEVCRLCSRACLWSSLKLRHLIAFAPHARVARLLQKYASNRESMSTLRKHIECLNAMVESVIPKDRPCPPTLKEQLRIFCEYVYIFTRTKPIHTHIIMCTDIANVYLGRCEVSQPQWRNSKGTKRTQRRRSSCGGHLRPYVGTR